MNPKIFLSVIFLVVTYWMFVIYKPFLLDIAIALLLALATSSANTFFTKRYNPLISSFILTGILSILLLGPIVYFFFSASSTLKGFDHTVVENTFVYVKDLLLNSPEFINGYKEQLESFLNSIDVTQISQNIFGIVGKTGLKSATFLKDIILILIFFFFFHLYGERFSNYILEAIPYDKGVVRASFNEASGTMSIVAYSILFTAIFEGLLFGVFISFFDYDWILFAILYGFASLIPVVGGMLMWLPIALYEVSQGHIQEAIIISLYTIIVISIIADTFIRPFIIEIINNKLNKSNTKINSLVIFFSIVAGLTAFGFWGAILGPGVTALFIGIINIFREENKHGFNSKDL